MISKQSTDDLLDSFFPEDYWNDSGKEVEKLKADFKQALLAYLLEGRPLNKVLDGTETRSETIACLSHNAANAAWERFIRGKSGVIMTSPAPPPSFTEEAEKILKPPVMVTRFTWPCKLCGCNPDEALTALTELHEREIRDRHNEMCNRLDAIKFDMLAELSPPDKGKYTELKSGNPDTAQYHE